MRLLAWVPCACAVWQCADYKQIIRCTLFWQVWRVRGRCETKVCHSGKACFPTTPSLIFPAATLSSTVPLASLPHILPFSPLFLAASCWNALSLSRLGFQRRRLESAWALTAPALGDNGIISDVLMSHSIYSISLPVKVMKPAYEPSLFSSTRCSVAFVIAERLYFYPASLSKCRPGSHWPAFDFQVSNHFRVHLIATGLIRVPRFKVRICKWNVTQTRWSSREMMHGDNVIGPGSVCIYAEWHTLQPFGSNSGFKFQLFFLFS